MLGIADRIADRIRAVVPQPTEWQRIGNQIDTAFVQARVERASLALPAARQGN